MHQKWRLKIGDAFKQDCKIDNLFDNFIMENFRIKISKKSIIIGLHHSLFHLKKVQMVYFYQYIY